MPWESTQTHVNAYCKKIETNGTDYVPTETIVNAVGLLKY